MPGLVSTQRLVAIVASTVAITCLLACGGGQSATANLPTSTPASSSPAPRVGFAYVSNSGDGTVSAFSLDRDAALASVPGSPFAAGPAPAGLASLLGNFLVVANGNDSASVFRIDRNTGALAPVTGSPFAAGRQTYAVAAWQQFVFVGNRGDGTISAYELDARTGALSAVPGSPFATGIVDLAALAVDLNNASQPMLVAGGGPQIENLRIQATGALQVGNGPVSLPGNETVTGISASGGPLFVVTSSSVHAFDERNTSAGFLASEAFGSPFLAGTSPRAFAASPAQGWALATNNDPRFNVVIMLVNQAGTLVEDDRSRTPDGPQFMVADQDVALLTNGANSTVQAYNITRCADPLCDVTLLAKTGNAAATGAGPTFVTLVR